MKFLCYILLLSNLLFVTSTNEEVMQWNGQRKLSWGDFKGVPQQKNKAVAITASGITYNLSASVSNKEVIVDCKVYAYFYPQESWYKIEHADANILAHEQLHFDITELMARKFRKRIAETRFSSNVKSEMRKIYKETSKELEALQDYYDEETNYSMDKEKQHYWQLYIDNQLQQLHNYQF